MSVVVVDEKMDCILLAVACSDGALRLVSKIKKLQLQVINIHFLKLLTHLIM